jgi:hypothetical protein
LRLSYLATQSLRVSRQVPRIRARRRQSSTSAGICGI